MKRLFILAISVSLFFVAHDQVEAQRLTAGMKKQLAQQMVKNAYNPDFFESCMKDAGGIDKIAHITAISLNTSSGKQYFSYRKSRYSYMCLWCQQADVLGVRISERKIQDDCRYRSMFGR